MPTLADKLTARLTAFPNLQALLDAPGGYRPSIYRDESPDHQTLADAYDYAQAQRGDPRRAFPPSPAVAREDRPENRRLASRIMGRWVNREPEVYVGAGEEINATKLAEDYADRYDLAAEDAEATIPEWVFEVSALVAQGRAA